MFLNDSNMKSIYWLSSLICEIKFFFSVTNMYIHALKCVTPFILNLPVQQNGPFPEVMTTVFLLLLDLNASSFGGDLLPLIQKYH